MLMRIALVAVMPCASRRLRARQKDDRDDVQERREGPREIVAPGRVVDRAGDERPPARHRAGQREEEADDRARLAAAEKVADDRGEERGDRAVRVAEHERVAEEQGEPAAGEEEAEEGDGLECHRDPDGALAADAVRDRSHDEAAGDGADAESRDDPGAGQRGVPEVARERHEVDERDEDRDPRRRERGAQHPERACPDRARQGPDALVGAGGGERHAGERDAEEEPAGGDHDAWAPEVGEPPGGKAEDAVGEGVDGKGPGEARAAPAELPQERVEEDAERVLGAVGDEEDKERAGDDDPAVEDTHDHTRPFLPLSFGSTSARNLPVYEPAVWPTTSGAPSATISPPSPPPSGPRPTT